MEGALSAELGNPTAPPIESEWLPIDFATAVRVASADSIEVERARLRLTAAEGEYESRVGALLPGLSPALLLEDVSGRVRGIEGPLLAADFTSFAPTLLLRWALNPGQALYERVAARRRLEASEHVERATRQELQQRSALQYYDLALARGRTAAAERALRESQELLRMATVRQRTGTGLEADVALAQSQLARREQELVLAVDAWHQASIALAITLRLDPAVALTPSEAALEPRTLVDEQIGLRELLELALLWREDLAAARALLGAAEADRKAQRWNLLGPRVDLGYQAGTIRSDTALGDFPASTQRRATAGASFNWSLSATGELQIARATKELAQLELAQRFELARAQVIGARAASTSAKQILPIVERRLRAAQERLRLVQSGLRAGTALALEVLQAEEALDQARLELNEAVARYNTAQIELVGALGVLDEEALGLAPTPSPSAQHAAAL